MCLSMRGADQILIKCIRLVYVYTPAQHREERKWQ